MKEADELADFAEACTLLFDMYKYFEDIPIKNKTLKNGIFATDEDQECFMVIFKGSPSDLLAVKELLQKRNNEE